MQKCKKKPVYADCRRGRRETAFIRRTGRKGNIKLTIEEFAAIVDEEIQNIKSIYSLT
jgi:hypothetical protein